MFLLLSLRMLNMPEGVGSAPVLFGSCPGRPGHPTSVTISDELFASARQIGARTTLTPHPLRYDHRLKQPRRRRGTKLIASFYSPVRANPLADPPLVESRRVLPSKTHPQPAMDPLTQPAPSSASQPSSAILDEEEALNAALAIKLSKLRGFREVLDQKSRQLQLLEKEKEEREALLSPLLDQVDELKVQVARQRAEIEATHEESAQRSRCVEGEVAQLREEVKRQKAAGKMLEGMRRDYRLCQEHCEAFLTTLIRLSRRRRNRLQPPGSGGSIYRSSSLEKIAGEEDAVGVEQQALLDTFFPPSLTPSSTSIFTQSPLCSSPSRRIKNKDKEKGNSKGGRQRPLWTSLRVLVEEVVSLLGELHRSQSEATQARHEKQNLAQRVQEMEQDLREVRGEVDEMKMVVEAHSLRAEAAEDDLLHARTEVDSMRAVMGHENQRACETEEKMEEMRGLIKAHASRTEAAENELRETRLLVGELESLAGHLRESVEGLEGAREQLNSELKERGDFLVGLVGRMKLLEEGEDEEEGRAEGGVEEAEGQSDVDEQARGATKTGRKRLFSSPDGSSSFSFLSLQRRIDKHLTHLMARLQLLHALHADATRDSHRREEELHALHQALKQLEEQKGDNVGAREICEQQQEQLQALAGRVKEYKVVVQEKDRNIMLLEGELMKNKERNERLGGDLARCQAGRDGERRLLQQRVEEAGAWKRQALKLQREVGEWHEKMKMGGIWSAGAARAGAGAGVGHGFGSSSSSSSNNGRRFW